MYIILKNLRADGFLYKVGDVIENDSKTINYEKLVAAGFIKPIKSSTRQTLVTEGQSQTAATTTAAANVTESTTPSVAETIAPVAKKVSTPSKSHKEKEV